MSVEQLNVVVLTKEAIATNAEMIKIKNGDPTKDQAIGRKSCKRRDPGSSAHSCPSSKILWPRVFLKSPSRMLLLQAFPHQLWEAATLK